MTFGEEELPRKFGRTILDARIGEGGMAEVFRARLIGQAFEKRVCVKRILPHLRRRPGFAEMFQDEARLLSGLQHEHIVHLFDFGDVDGALFLVMELIEGCALSDLLEHLQKQGKRLSVAQSLKVGTALAGALHHAHGATRDGKPLGIVHRDVTPHNLLLGRDGAIKLTDFGVAHAADRQSRTETGALKGKLAYMSPEQAHGQDLDHRSDQFATGIVLWECLTGRRLFEGKSELNILEAVTQKTIPRVSSLRSDVPPAVDSVVATMLQRDQRQRFADMGVVEAELQQALFQARKRAGDDDLRPLVAEATATSAVTPTRSMGASVGKGALGNGRRASSGTTGPIVTLPPLEPSRGLPVAAIGGGVVIALVVVIGVAVAFSGEKKPSVVVDGGSSAVVALPPVPVLASSGDVTSLADIALPRLARRSGTRAVVATGGGGVSGVLTSIAGGPDDGRGDGVTTIAISGDFDDAAEVVVDVRRSGTTRLIVATTSTPSLALRRQPGAVVDRVVIIGPGSVRVVDGGPPLDGAAIARLPSQPVGIDVVSRGGPTVLRQAQSHAGVVDLVVVVSSPAQLTIVDGPLGDGAEETLATPAERDALRAVVDRVIAHPSSCDRRCEDVSARLRRRTDDGDDSDDGDDDNDDTNEDGVAGTVEPAALAWQDAVTAADVGRVRRAVDACVACLDAMGAP